MKKYKYMKIGIASPEEMITWANPELQGKNFVFNPNNKDKVVLLDEAGNELRDENGKVVEYVLHGEVKKSETINYRTQKPEKDGLFCEVIFGPVKDYCCACGKPARKSVGEHQKCDKCGVEFTESKVRRERMGYIALSAPVVHTWYLKNTPSKIAILLDMKTKEVESIVRQSSFIVTKVDETVDPDDLYVGQILTEQENAKFKRHYFGKFKSSTGAEIIKYLLKNIDLGKVMKEIRCELVSPTESRRDFLEHRKSLINQFYVDQPINWEKVDLNKFLSVSDMECLLDIKPREYDGLMAKTSYLVVDSTVREVENLSIISEQENNVKKKLYPGAYKTLTGTEALLYKLSAIDFEEELKLVALEAKSPTKQNKEKLVKRLEIVEAFYHSDNKPEWMVMDVVPVIPPDLRPMVQLEGGRFATTDLNELYRRILHRNTRLRKMYELGTPELITKNEKRLLQEAVDSLIDNSKRGGKAAEAKKGPLKSLSDILRGKQGRFRQNLLGKRVDYSGRSVICVGPFLKMYQCGIPYEMALTLFKPFVISYLRKAQNLDNQIADIDQNGVPISNAAKEKAGIKKAKELIEKGAPEAMDALEKIVVEHPVLLNRAPTLHRLSIQAFEPVLVQGKAIRLHPLATTAFNADFDGDQMPVHVPLSEEAQAEARMLMLASKNILAPKDGKPVVTPSQDMIIGNYYLTIERSQPDLQFSDFNDLYKAYENRIFEHDNKIIVNGDEENPYRDIEELADEIKAGKTPSFGKFLVVGREGKAFKDISEIEHAYEEAEIDFHTRFVIPGRAIDKPFVNLDKSLPNYEERVKLNEKLKDMYLVTTYGKIIFNQVFPENFVFFAEPDIKKDCLANLKDGTPERFFLPRGVNFKEEIAKMPLNQPVKKKTLSLIISEVFRQCKLAETSLTLDKMKDLGFYYSTISGITISAFDVETLVKKYEIIEAAEKNVNIYNRLYRRGTMLNAEREKKVIQIWKDAKVEIKNEIDKVMKEKATVNDIFMMADSGARGSADNFTQLAGMRGLMNKPNGEEMETPVKSNFAEGMSMADFFNSTHGARKGSTDTALKTAESGYLTRRLVDVSQDITITQFDCGTDKGIFMHTVYKPLQEGEKKSDDKILVALRDRILGRFAAKPVYAKVSGKKVKLCDRNDFIDIELADKIIAAINWRDETEGVWVRTNLTCNCPVGVCVRCYGSDLSTNGIVEVGEVVGIVAAQSIGEPGTQLTMRTFHSGGVAGGSEDITQGLPRVQELFEARAPKGQAVISEIKGTVTSVELTSESRFTIHIVGDVPGNDKDYPLDYGKKPRVKVGDHVEPGDLLNDGAINVKDLLRVASSNKVENYILEQIQLSYRTAAGVEISDKHVEIIVKQMLQKVVVIDAGETDLLPGSFVSKSELYNILKDCVEKGLRIPAVKPVILGITRASLKSDSFLAAASFQETTRVLTEAAIRGKVDKLEGLKENIIIGGLIPAGTGLVGDIDLKVENPTETYDIKKL